MSILQRIKNVIKANVNPASIDNDPVEVNCIEAKLSVYIGGSSCVVFTGLFPLDSEPYSEFAKWFAMEQLSENDRKLFRYEIKMKGNKHNTTVFVRNEVKAYSIYKEFIYSEDFINDY